jgi:hypothetical protein
MSNIIQHNLYIYIILTSVYCAPSYMFKPIHMAIFRLLREEVFYNTVQLHYISIMCYTRSHIYMYHGRMAVKCKFYNPVYRWCYVRYCSCSPGASSCVFFIMPVYFLLHTVPMCSFYFSGFDSRCLCCFGSPGCALVLCCLMFVSGFMIIYNTTGMYC